MASVEVKICVGILTVTRPERYLIQTAHAILKYITSKERGQIYLFAINGNKNTGEEQPGDLNLISSYFDDILLSPTAMQNTRKHSSNLNMDYAKALRHCASKAPQPPYTLIIEDDALAAPFFFSHVTKAIDLVQRKDEKAPTAVSRFFYNEIVFFGMLFWLGAIAWGREFTSGACYNSINNCGDYSGGRTKKIRRSGYRPNVNFRKKKNITKLHFYGIFIHFWGLLSSLFAAYYV